MTSILYPPTVDQLGAPYAHPDWCARKQCIQNFGLEIAHDSGELWGLVPEGQWDQRLSAKVSTYRSTDGPDGAWLVQRPTADVKIEGLAPGKRWEEEAVVSMTATDLRAVAARWRELADALDVIEAGEKAA